LLLDQGLPRSAAIHLHRAGIEGLHVGDKGLSTATDSAILEFGRQQGMTVVTLDADFHKLLAISGVKGPSVIRVRIEGLRAETLARLLVDVLKICRDELSEGAMVSVTRNHNGQTAVRIRKLPIARRIY
jgi:predicted nuclease of predicted toxin-antitoxin system